MVEAALIFPLVIAAMTALICIVAGLYSSLSLQASIHMDLRKECGEFSQTVYRPDMMIKDFPSDMDLAGIRPVIRIEAEREYKIISLFRQSLIRTEAGQSYVIDEAELIRILSLGDEP